MVLLKDAWLFWSSSGFDPRSVHVGHPPNHCFTRWNRFRPFHVPAFVNVTTAFWRPGGDCHDISSHLPTSSLVTGSNVSSKSYLSHELSKNRSPKKKNKMNLGLPRFMRPRFIKWKQQNDHTCCQKNKIIPQQQWHDGSFSAEDLPKPIAVVEKISNNSFCPYIYMIYIYI